MQQAAGNLHSDQDVEDKIKLFDPWTVQKLIRTYLEEFGELPPRASCDKLVQMDLKLKPEFVGQKIRRRPYPAPKEQADEMGDRYENISTLAWFWSTKMGTIPNIAAPVSWWLGLGLQPNGS